ncbi:MAG: helix-turn-helix domain-containing protein [Treponema sp.]|jgi:DNA-binding XRE family transcriptional regulator|nr:helix-turn-helix domain-containing protein [Treponema sp.]
MQVQERTRHIDVTIPGTGLDKLKHILAQNMPEAVIDDDDDITIDWESTDLCKTIRANQTPGKLLQAYRERAGLSLVALAQKTGIKYTNISAMEHDNRVIGLSSARRFAAALNCEYTKFIAS